MTVESKWRGHPIAAAWTYADNGRAVADDPRRDCGHCNLPDTPDGHDGCLGTLPLVTNACCGHGCSREAYVQLAWLTVSGAPARLLQLVLRWIGGRP